MNEDVSDLIRGWQRIKAEHQAQQVAEGLAHLNGGPGAPDRGVDKVTVVIGSRPNLRDGEDHAITVDDVYASGRHAKLTVYADRIMYLEDLGSTNGTWWGPVGGQPRKKVAVATPVHLGYPVKIGRTVVTVREILAMVARMRGAV